MYNTDDSLRKWCLQENWGNIKKTATNFYKICTEKLWIIIKI